MAQSKVFKLLSSTSSSIRVNAAEMNTLLSKIGKNEVAVYSIYGKFKTGKTFMLNCMLKFLVFGKSNRNNWINMTLAQQFACDGGANKCTEGIDIWPKPFLVDVGNGKQVAVLLMDTQGLFDDESPVTDNPTVFAFSALLSSLMIYNVMNTMDQRDWQFLDFLMNFVTQAVHVNSEKQDDKLNMNILIRDWENMNEFCCGTHTELKPAAAERNLRSHFFHSQNDREIASGTRSKSILKYINKCSVTALPYPGKELATTKNAAVALGDEEFTENLKEYIQQLFSPEAVLSNRKNIGGSFVTGEVLAQLVSKWAGHFRNSTLPAPHSVYLSTAELQHINKIKQILEEFKVSVGQCLDKYAEGYPNIQRFLNEKVKFYVEQFEKCRIMGKKDFESEYKATLRRNLETASKVFAQKNDAKVQEAKTRRDRLEMERLKKIREDEVKAAAERARLDALAKQRELQRLQEHLEREKINISQNSGAVQITAVPGTNPQQYDVVLGSGTFSLSNLVPGGRIRNLTITCNVTLN